MKIKPILINDISMWLELSNEYDCYVKELVPNLKEWYEGNLVSPSFSAYMNAKIAKNEAYMAVSNKKNECLGIIAISKRNNNITFFAVSHNADFKFVGEKLFRHALSFLNREKPISINVLVSDSKWINNERVLCKEFGFVYKADSYENGVPTQTYIKYPVMIKMSKNIELREFRVSDAAMFFHNNQDASIRQFLDYRYYTNQVEAQKILEDFISRYPTKDFPFYLAIVKRKTDQLIGHIGIGRMRKGYEIEFALGKEFRGINYAVEAVETFVKWCKENIVSESIYALVNPENEASCKVLEKAGFTLIENASEIVCDSESKPRKIYYY